MEPVLSELNVGASTPYYGNYDYGATPGTHRGHKRTVATCPGGSCRLPPPAPRLSPLIHPSRVPWCWGWDPPRLPPPLRGSSPTQGRAFPLDSNRATMHLIFCSSPPSSSSIPPLTKDPLSLGPGRTVRPRLRGGPFLSSPPPSPALGPQLL